MNPDLPGVSPEGASPGCSRRGHYPNGDAMTEWQPIETAPRDGTWFLICRANEGWESYEIGAYDPLFHDRFTEVGAGGLYKKEVVITYEWRGFNNFDRATHWMPLPEPPK